MARKTHLPLSSKLTDTMLKQLDIFKIVSCNDNLDKFVQDYDSFARLTGMYDLRLRWTVLRREEGGELFLRGKFLNTDTQGVDLTWDPNVGTGCAVVTKTGSSDAIGWLDASTTVFDAYRFIHYVAFDLRELYPKSATSGARSDMLQLWIPHIFNLGNAEIAHAVTAGLPAGKQRTNAAHRILLKKRDDMHEALTRRVQNERLEIDLDIGNLSHLLLSLPGPKGGTNA